VAFVPDPAATAGGHAEVPDSLQTEDGSALSGADSCNRRATERNLPDYLAEE
jgi:hypothetical protein